MFLLMVMAALLIFDGCGTARYSIKSDPSDATVYLNEKAIGRTPLEIRVKDLPLEENLQLNFVKINYGELKTVVPGPRIGSLGEEIVVRIPKQESQTDLVNRRMAQILNAHTLAIHNHFAEAIQAIDQVLAEDPKLVAAQLLKASVMFLGKNYAGAQTQYEKVLELDPSNQEATRMIQYLREHHS
jgi:tetratricopeptide (TPR) repeat protein